MRIKSSVLQLIEGLMVSAARNGSWGRLIRETSIRHPTIHGFDIDRLSIHPTADVSDAMLNIGSGRITIGAHAFFGPGVSLLTGTHDVSKRGLERQLCAPTGDRDITIGDGVWLGPGVTVVGPVSIGAGAVVVAGSLVIHHVPAGAVVGGVPATP